MLCSYNREGQVRCVSLGIAEAETEWHVIMWHLPVWHVAMWLGCEK